jgi:hypothetical protein
MGGPRLRADRMLWQPCLHLIHAFSTGVITQKKNQSLLAKKPKPVFPAPVLRLPHEVVHQQQLPVVRPRNLHHGNPVHLLQVRFETHVDEKRNHTRAENSAGNQQENCLKIPASHPWAGVPHFSRLLREVDDGLLADHMYPNTDLDLFPGPVRGVDRRLERDPQRQARAVS